jgi:hypothetical protein
MFKTILARFLFWSMMLFRAIVAPSFQIVSSLTREDNLTMMSWWSLERRPTLPARFIERPLAYWASVIGSGPPVGAVGFIWL